MIEHVKKGCPLCGETVKGNRELQFYCKHCNIMFHKRDLACTKEHLEHFIKKKIIRKINRDLLRKVYD